MSEGNFEARKIGMRQNKDGVIISLVVQPDDYEAALAMVPIGARLMIGWAEIGDDEKPKEIPSQRGTTLDQAFVEPTAEEGGRGDSRERPAHPKRPFSSLSLAAQAGMRCEEALFRSFLVNQYYKTWTAAYDIDKGMSECAATVVRELCGVISRAELDNNSDGAVRWGVIEKAYQAYLTDQKYAGARR